MNTQTTPAKEYRKPIDIKAYIRLARPSQWTKNLLVFAGLIFAGKVPLFPEVIRSIITFAAFCLISSAIYALNDIYDVDQDRLHPIKKMRPLAAGLLTLASARWFALCLSVSALAVASIVSYKVALVCLGYGLLNLAYSRKLKHIVIIDVMVVAAGFVLRAFVGTVAVSVMISPWLLVCTILLALLLAICKRRCEIAALAKGAESHRPILSQYSAGLLDQLISTTSAATIMAYSIYTFQSQTGQHAPYLMLTIPFVIYGIFRYLYIVYQKGGGGEPERVLLHDRPTLLNIFFWILTSGLIIYLSINN